MSAEFPTRIPLLWLLAPFALGIIAGRLFPTEIHPGVYAIAIIFAFVAAAIAKRRVALWMPMLLPATTLTGYVYIVQTDEVFNSSYEYPEREATLTLEISRLYESTHLKTRGVARISDAESHLNHFQDLETYFSVEPVKGETFEETLKIGSVLRARGVLSFLDSPENHQGFSSYLRNSGVATLFSRATVISVETPRSSWNRWLHKLRSLVATRSRSASPAPNPSQGPIGP